MRKTKNEKPICRHDYKNAVLIGKIDRMCPLCKELIDPNEWFLITWMESLGAHFVEVKSEESSDKLDKELTKLKRRIKSPQKPLDVSPKAHHYDK